MYFLVTIKRVICPFIFYRQQRTTKLSEIFKVEQRKQYDHTKNYFTKYEIYLQETCCCEHYKNVIEKLNIDDE